MLTKRVLLYCDAIKLEEELGTENSDDSQKQAMCDELEQLLAKLDPTHPEIIRIANSDTGTMYLTMTTLIEIEDKDYHRGIQKQ